MFLEFILIMTIDNDNENVKSHDTKNKVNLAITLSGEVLFIQLQVAK